MNEADISLGFNYCWIGYRGTGDSGHSWLALHIFPYLWTGNAFLDCIGVFGRRVEMDEITI
jgi:hypothetical protein